MRSKLFALRTIFYVKLVLVLSFFALAVALQAQDQTQPRVDVKVNKQFDDRGNLVRYDSVYTWGYSNGNVPAHILQGHLGRSPQLMNLQKYTDSLWRSMLQPMNIMFMDPATRQLMQSMQEALKKLPERQGSKTRYGNTGGGGKKAVAKATRVITI